MQAELAELSQNGKVPQKVNVDKLLVLSVLFWLVISSSMMEIKSTPVPSASVNMHVFLYLLG